MSVEHRVRQGYKKLQECRERESELAHATIGVWSHTTHY